MIRPHHAVFERLAWRATQAGFASGRVSPYIADVLAIDVGLGEHVHELNQEVLGAMLAWHGNL